jgi:hypothetical protein
LSYRRDRLLQPAVVLSILCPPSAALLASCSSFVAIKLSFTANSASLPFSSFCELASSARSLLSSSLAVSEISCLRHRESAGKKYSIVRQRNEHSTFKKTTSSSLASAITSCCQRCSDATAGSKTLRTALVLCLCCSRKASSVARLCDVTVPYCYFVQSASAPCTGTSSAQAKVLQIRSKAHEHSYNFRCHFRV